jgi:chlorophyllide a reductase subunit Y
VVQKAKARAIPALYFTNLISARPLFGIAGAGSLAQVVNSAIAGKARFDTMREFFEGVGEGDTGGVWQGTPVLRPDFREKFRKAAAAQARKRKSEEMV